MLCIVNGAGIAYFQPWENGDVQVIVKRVFYFVAVNVMNVMQRCKV